MKTCIASILATAVAAMVLPASLSAQGLNTNPASPQSFSAITAGQPAHESAMAGAIVNSVPPASTNTLTENIGGQPFNSSGILIHDGAAYIVHRIQTDLTLPDGSRVQPDGAVIGSDGSKKEMGPDQMMTLDGHVKTAPFTATDVDPNSGSNAPKSDDYKTAPFSSSVDPFPDQFEDELNFPAVTPPESNPPRTSAPTTAPFNNGELDEEYQD